MKPESDICSNVFNHTRKPWRTPEVRDQSIASSTMTKSFNNPTEASPQTGS